MSHRSKHEYSQVQIYGCTSEDLSAKVTRSGRISYKPLEYWNFEQLDQTKDHEGHVKVVRKKTEVQYSAQRIFFPSDTSVICREPLTEKQIKGRLYTSTWVPKPVKKKMLNRSVPENISSVTKSGRLSSKPAKHTEVKSKVLENQLRTEVQKARNKEEDTGPKPQLNHSLITKSGRNSFTPVRYGIIPPRVSGLVKEKNVRKESAKKAEILASSLFGRSPRVRLKKLSPSKLRIYTPTDARPRTKTPKKRDHQKLEDLCIEESGTKKTHKENEAVVSDRQKDVQMPGEGRQRKRKEGSTEKSNKEREDTSEKLEDTCTQEETHPPRRKKDLIRKARKASEDNVSDKPKDANVHEETHPLEKEKGKLTEDETFEEVSKAAHFQEALVDPEKCAEFISNEVPFDNEVAKPISKNSSAKVYNFELKELTWSGDEDDHQEASALSFPSPTKRNQETSSRTCLTSVIETEDSSAKVTRSGRLSYKPLEYWNFEKLDQEKTGTGQMKVVRTKSEIQGCNGLSRVSQQGTSDAQFKSSQGTEFRKTEEKSSSQINESVYEQDEKIVKKFSDLKFYKVKGGKKLKAYVAQGLCMPEERFETGFVFLQEGNFVWTLSAGCMKVQVLKGHGVLNIENSQETQRDITEGSLFHVEAGQKFTVRNNFGVKSPVLKMFILKYF